jgi:hypothetical protein
MVGIALAIVFLLLYNVYQRQKALQQQVNDLQRELTEWRKQKESKRVSTEVSGIKTEKEKSDASSIAKPKLANKPKEQPIVKPKQKSRTRTEWELLIGGKWLNWIGAIALFLGVSFFMKYAFDHNWINEVARVAIGAIVGAILLYFGRIIALKGLYLFSQGLVGAGIAVLYTAVFAAYNFYALLSQSAAIVAMVVVTALCLQQAIYYRSQAVALLGWFGAYGTPFLFPGEGETLGLLSYLLFVTTGMLVISWVKRSWQLLYYLSFIAVYVMIFSWNIAVTVEPHRTFLFALICIWLLFYCHDLRAMVVPLNGKWQKIISVGNTICLTFGMFLHLSSSKTSLALGLLLLAIAYLLPLIFFYRRHLLAHADRWQLMRQVTTFVVYLLWATGVYFDFPVFLCLAALQLSAVIWWGLHYRVQYIERFGLTLLGLCTFVILLYAVNGWDILQRAWDWRVSNLVLMMLLFMLSASWYQKRNFPKIQHYLQVSWVVLGWLTVILEGRFLYVRVGNQSEQTGYIVTMLILSLLFVYLACIFVFAIQNQSKTVLNTSIGLVALTSLAVAIMGTSYYPLVNHLPVWNVRVLAFVLGITVCYVIYRLWQHRGWLLVMAVVGAFELITVEIYDSFQKQMAIAGISSSAVYLEHLQFYSIVLVWLLLSIPVYLWSISLRYRLLMFVGLSMLGIGAIPILLGGLSYYSLENFVPVFNLRFFAFSAVIAIFYFFYRQLEKELATGSVIHYIRQGLFYLGVVAAFLGISLEVYDTFVAQMILADGKLSFWQNLQQLAMSLAWLILACGCLWIGIWRHKQSVRLLAICIIGLTVIKIFFFDLSFLDTLYRIFSFLVLGAVLLSVSFVYQKYRHWFTGDES